MTWREETTTEQRSARQRASRWLRPILVAALILRCTSVFGAPAGDDEDRKLDGSLRHRVRQGDSSERVSVIVTPKRGARARILAAAEGRRRDRLAVVRDRDRGALSPAGEEPRLEKRRQGHAAPDGASSPPPYQGAVALTLLTSRDAFGVKPTANAVKAMLQHSSLKLADANRVPYDVLTQGAGSLNAMGAVSLAGSLNPRVAVVLSWTTKGITEATTIDGQSLTWSQNVVCGAGRQRGVGLNVVWGERRS